MHHVNINNAIYMATQVDPINRATHHQSYVYVGLGLAKEGNFGLEWSGGPRRRTAMLIKIGSSVAETGDVVDLLLACHERIRFFIDLAIRIADTTDASNEEIREAAARVVRYFSESLPLHVADEEESIHSPAFGT
jgi:hypothetical protein